MKQITTLNVLVLNNIQLCYAGEATCPFGRQEVYDVSYHRHSLYSIIFGGEYLWQNTSRNRKCPIMER